MEFRSSELLRVHAGELVLLLCSAKEEQESSSGLCMEYPRCSRVPKTRLGMDVQLHTVVSKPGSPAALDGLEASVGQGNASVQVFVLAYRAFLSFRKHSCLVSIYLMVNKFSRIVNGKCFKIACSNVAEAKSVLLLCVEKC